MKQVALFGGVANGESISIDGNPEFIVIFKPEMSDNKISLEKPEFVTGVKHFYNQSIDNEFVYRFSHSVKIPS